MSMLTGYVIGAIIAGGAGFGAGYFFCKKRIFEMYTVVEEEIEPLVVETIGPKEKNEEADSKDIKDEPKAETKSIDAKEEFKNLYQKAFTDYAGLGRDPRKGPKNDEEVEDFRPPYLITEDDYSRGNRHYDKIILNYFEDGVFVDDRTDEPDPGIEKILSLNIKEMFGRGSDDADAVYIRNERLNADYYIIRKHQTYQSYSGCD